MTRENENDIGLFLGLAIYFAVIAMIALMTWVWLGMIGSLPYVGLCYLIFEALNLEGLSEICCSYFVTDDPTTLTLAIDTIQCGIATIIFILAIYAIYTIAKVIRNKIIAKKVS